MLSQDELIAEVEELQKNLPEDMKQQLAEASTALRAKKLNKVQLRSLNTIFKMLKKAAEKELAK